MKDIAYGWKGAGKVRSLGDAKERVRKAFNEWRRADYIAEDTPAFAYLVARRVQWLAAKPLRQTIRWRPDARHPSGAMVPAIYCAVTDVYGAFRAVHRIFLKPDKPEKFGKPASFGPLAGHSIKLATLDQIVAADDVVIGEGLETTASACALLGLPGWCGIAAGNIRKSLILPADIKRVTIAVDRDPPGERAANAAGKRWRAEGREVRFFTPSRIGEDANDILRRHADHG